MKKLIALTIKAIKQFNLIDEGDVVVVGLSGGKDSMLTATLLHEISKFYKPSFRVVAVSLDCTGGESIRNGAYDEIKAFLEARGIELHIVPCDILKIVFEDRKETSPCSLCANLRRGRLNAYAKELGATKVALGHHADDFIETLFLNTVYGGHLTSFSPKTYLNRIDITQIRPLFFVKESEVVAGVKALGIPILNNCCQANGHTKRQLAKEELTRLETIVPGAKERIFDAALRLPTSSK